MITDTFDSYSAAKQDVMPSVEHRRQRGLNNRLKTHISQHDDQNGR